MGTNKRKKEYSTLVIVNKNNPNTKSFSIRTKHITRLKYYLLTVVLLIVGLTSSLVVYINKSSENALAAQKLEQFKREIAGPLATDTNIARSYIKSIDSKLGKIKKYLHQRGVKTALNHQGGINNPDVSALDSYRYYNIYLASLLRNIKHMPLGYPHKNHNNSRFGYRSNPFHGGGSEFHSGVDISGDTGDPIRSTADGTVVLADWSQGYGQCVRIQHKHGYETLYGHLSKINVKNGQQVKANQVIGELGSTGRSTGPHLHYEVRYLGKPINPTNFFKL